MKKKLNSLLMIALLSVILLLPKVGLCGGPVIISGLDTEWGIRPGSSSHGTIAMWAGVINTGILSNVTSCGPLVNPSGNILVIGGGKGPFATDHMTNFWTQIGTALGRGITFVNGAAAISSQSFNGFSMIAVCNTVDGEGKLTQLELNAISARQADIASFVNCGGGLFASSCNLSPAYGYINVGTPALVSVNDDVFNSTPTPQGILMGISNISGPYHNNFTQWPSFLTVLSNLPDPLRPCILGGTNVTIPATVYCCTGQNLFNNGNFEAGNVGFTSSYTYQPAVTANAVRPRLYNVVNNAQAAAISPQWLVEDHTKCINGANSKFLVVNGRTIQAAGTSSVIWDQTATVTPNAEYKFCANVKNLAQCAFDIKPQIRVVITGGTWTTGSSAYQTINITAGLCNWMQIGGCIRATGPTLRVQIFLYESGIGDGNDLALDDISLQKKLDQPSTLSVQHQVTPTRIQASINSIATSDDILVTTACGTLNIFTYQWFVYEVTAAPGFPMVPGTNAWSTNLAGYNNQTSLPVGPWALTTTFPGYNFAPNKLYLIGLSIPSCCNSCYADKWMYQITGYFGLKASPQYNLTEEMKEYIKAMIKEKPVNVDPNDKSIFKVTPNPSNGIFQVVFDAKTSGTITITDSKGSKITEKIISNEKTTDFNLSGSGSGIYFIKLNSGDKVYSEKIIKQ